MGDEYSQSYGAIVMNFAHSIKDVILQLYISDHQFRSIDIGDDVDFILDAFDLRYQKEIKLSKNGSEFCIFYRHSCRGVYKKT